MFYQKINLCVYEFERMTMKWNYLGEILYTLVNVGIINYYLILYNGQGRRYVPQRSQ